MNMPASAARWEFLRFAIVGTLVAAVYFALFVLLARTSLSQLVVNAVAFCTAVALQYALQSKWTFRKDLADPAQIARFLGTIGIGLVLSSAISGGLGPALNWPATVTAAVVIVTLPISNFILFKLWVFARN
jgi:putative flippase GtrA